MLKLSFNFGVEPMRIEKKGGKLFFQSTILLVCIYVLILIVYEQVEKHQLPEISIADNNASILSERTHSYGDYIVYTHKNSLSDFPTVTGSKLCLYSIENDEIYVLANCIFPGFDWTRQGMDHGKILAYGEQDSDYSLYDRCVWIDMNKLKNDYEAPNIYPASFDRNCMIAEDGIYYKDLTGVGAYGSAEGDSSDKIVFQNAISGEQKYVTPPIDDGIIQNCIRVGTNLCLTVTKKEKKKASDYIIAFDNTDNIIFEFPLEKGVQVMKTIPVNTDCFITLLTNGKLYEFSISKEKSRIIAQTDILGYANNEETTGYDYYYDSYYKDEFANIVRGSWLFISDFNKNIWKINTDTGEKHSFLRKPQIFEAFDEQQISIEYCDNYVVYRANKYWGSDSEPMKMLIYNYDGSLLDEVDF